MTDKKVKNITKTGDKGTTGLADGSRVLKTSLRIQAIGEVDELNSWFGVLLSEGLPEDISQAVIAIQRDLFSLGAELASLDKNFIGDIQIKKIESFAKKFDSELPPLKNFILPGGVKAAAIFHLARSVCRRVERTLFSMKEKKEISNEACVYLNRLGDLLFIWARVLNKRGNQTDLLWNNSDDL